MASDKLLLQDGVIREFEIMPRPLFHSYHHLHNSCYVLKGNYFVNIKQS